MRFSPLLVSLAACVNAAACEPVRPIADASTDVIDMDAALFPDIPSFDAGRDEAGRPVILVHESVPRTLAPGEEQNGLCESFTIGNIDPLYVNAVSFSATPGMHHSNWLFVPPSYYAGPDGTWPCASRGFDQGAAASVGGVLFAQSTQATGQVQQFPPGVAIPLPPNARIIGQLHMLNVTPTPVDIGTRIEIHPIARDEVVTRLSGFYLEYGPLDLQPHTRSLSTTACDFGTEHQRLVGRQLDFHLYYGMPHYHARGRSMRVDVVGGPNDGASVFATNQLIGEPDGHLIMPAYDLTGATGLRITCEFDNPRDVPVHYGVGDQEMCIFLGFTESEYQWAGIAEWDQPAATTTNDAGMQVHEATCNRVYGLLSRAYSR
jgi:hypothetical protein